MIKVPVEYEDFDGNEQTTDCYFHLSKSELIKMETDTPGGLVAKIKRIGSDAAEGAEIIGTFSWIVERAYGQRVDNDPSKFFKSEKIRSEFMTGLLFDALLSKLLTDPVFAIEFMSGVVPNDLAKIAAKINSQKAEENVELPWANREPTEKELMGMTQTQMLEIWKRRDQAQQS